MSVPDRAAADERVNEYDFILKGSSPTTQFLLDQGIDTYFTDQNTGDIIMTKPHSLHSVFKNGVGLAFARTFQLSETLLHLDEEVHMHQNVRQENFIHVSTDDETGVALVCRFENWTSCKN